MSVRRYAILFTTEGAGALERLLSEARRLRLQPTGPAIAMEPFDSQGHLEATGSTLDLNNEDWDASIKRHSAHRRDLAVELVAALSGPSIVVTSQLSYQMPHITLSWPRRQGQSPGAIDLSSFPRDIVGLIRAARPNICLVCEEPADFVEDAVVEIDGRWMVAMENDEGRSFGIMAILTENVEDVEVVNGHDRGSVAVLSWLTGAGGA